MRFDRRLNKLHDSQSSRRTDVKPIRLIYDIRLANGVDPGKDAVCDIIVGLHFSHLTV